MLGNDLRRCLTYHESVQMGLQGYTKYTVRWRNALHHARGSTDESENAWRYFADLPSGPASPAPSGPSPGLYSRTPAARKLANL
jgi:hypothetical protein